jgi:hypothetical protein
MGNAEPAGMDAGITGVMVSWEGEWQRKALPLEIIAWPRTR